MARIFFCIIGTLCIAGDLFGIAGRPCHHGQSLTLADTSCALFGLITDLASKQPIISAHVTIRQTSQGTFSSDDGTYCLEGIPPGVYSVTVSSIGYRTITKDSVLITGAGPLQVNFALPEGSVISEEVVISATGRSQSIRLAPVSISTVSALQMQQQSVTTFDQAFDHVPGVVVTRSSRANVQALSIRGASEVAGGGTGNRVLLLIDGRPAISPESGGVLWNLVPVNAIDKVEVLRGAYSALFGSSAMGGVVNIITKKPRAEAETTLHLNYGFYQKAPVSSGYTALNDFNTIEFSRSRKWERFEYVFDVARRADDGHREKSGFELYNLYSKFKFNFSRNRSIAFSANYNLMNNDTPATWLSSRQAYSVADHKKDDFQDRRELNADLYYQSIVNQNLKYSARFYYYQNFSAYTFNDDPANDSTNINIGKQIVDRSAIRSERLGNVTQFEVFASDAHFIIGGIDLKYDRVTGLPEDISYGRHQAASAGIYVQDEFTISDQWNLTAGIRYDYYEILNTFSESNVSPKLSLVWQPAVKARYRVHLAQAFRNPAIAERFIKYDQGGGIRFSPNPRLRAEKLILSAEIGANLSISKTLNLDIAFFHNRYRDLISFQQISQPGEELTFEVINLNKAVMQGVEARAQYTPLENLTILAGYTFLDARDSSPDRLNDALPYKVRHTATLQATWSIGNLNLHGQARYRSRTEEVFIYPGDEPGQQCIVDSRISYDLADKYAFYISLQNMTNALYEELERYRMPGRNYTFGVRIQF